MAETPSHHLDLISPQVTLYKANLGFWFYKVVQKMIFDIVIKTKIAKNLVENHLKLKKHFLDNFWVSETSIFKSGQI